ncbi:unnamed protein product [Moneuplotes crassus]|uniref:Uncharacterized protein n=1 Tax=Euplotes crassus TaxID=5936 RepID=A0AAD1Y559_EUPCR|nr:unnamed protein product [Moneuplotes crassus]
MSEQDDGSSDDSFYKVDKREEDKTPFKEKAKLIESLKRDFNKKEFSIKSLERKTSRNPKNKGAQVKAHIKKMDIFLQVWDFPSPTDYMNWFLSNINTLITPKMSVKTESKSVGVLSLDQDSEEKSFDCDYKSVHSSTMVNCDKDEDHLPYFESIRISTVTWKGSNSNGEIIGEKITPETRVNCYLDKYNIVICLDFSQSMSAVDESACKMYFQKMKEVVNATLFNLSCAIKKNDRINKESFIFKPRICLTIIGCGLPDLTSNVKSNEHICREDIVESSLPILVLNYEVDIEQIWALVQRVNSQIYRFESLAQKIINKSNTRYRSESLDRIIQNIIFVLTKSEPKSFPIVILVTDCCVSNSYGPYYNSMIMQLCRLDAKCIVVSLENETNHKNSFGYINSHEAFRILAMVTKGYYLKYKDFERYSKYSEDSTIKIERVNNKNRLTPLQKIIFCRPIYYDSMFSDNRNIADFRTYLAQRKNIYKHKNIGSQFEIMNPNKLMNYVFAPVYKKLQYTEYTLKCPFKSICEVRTFESFILRSIKTKEDSENALKSAEFVFYWSQNILISYILCEIVQDKRVGHGQEKLLKAVVFITADEEILKKFHEDKHVSIYQAEMRKKYKHSMVKAPTSTYERIQRFVKDIFTTDRIVANLEQLGEAFRSERIVHKYFNDGKEPFMETQKSIDHTTRMNKFSWCNDDPEYLEKIETIPRSKLEQAEKREKYLYHALSFKKRHAKLLAKIKKKMDVSNWHSNLKVGRFDILCRSINPLISNPEQNKEIIIRRMVFKVLYKYCSLALSKDLLVKDISTKDENKLIFTSLSWMTPNFCVVFVGMYNTEGNERLRYLKEIESIFTNEEMKAKGITYILYDSRVSSLLVTLPIDVINKRKRLERQAELEKNNPSYKTKSTLNHEMNNSGDFKEIPNYIFRADSMNIFNFVPYKHVRLANSFCKKWIWCQRNKKIIQDFINIIARHRICEGFELVHTCNDELLFIKVVKLEKYYTGKNCAKVQSLIQYLIKQDKNNPTYVKTEIYLEKESGHYHIKSEKKDPEHQKKVSCDECECHEKEEEIKIKETHECCDRCEFSQSVLNNENKPRIKFSSRKKKRVKDVRYREINFFQQLCNYFTGMDKFLFTNICTYHNLLTNALERRVDMTRDKIINKQPITSEICYFQGTMDDKYINIIRTLHDEMRMKLKIIMINEDMRKYMKDNYLNIHTYNKENEKKLLEEIDQLRGSDDDNIDAQNNDEKEEQKQTHNENTIHGCSCAPEKIFGENIGLSIDLLLDNSEKIGEEHFYVPDVPGSLILNSEFGQKYYEKFYGALLKVFEDFADHQIDSQKYQKEENFFLKCISKDQLFVIKINTFEIFYRKSIRFIKKGKDVFIKASYFHINNVLLNLSYNDTKMILHNLNPHYEVTQEWTKEYFGKQKNIQIDYSDFDLDYYLEEENEDWLNFETNVLKVINNFMNFLRQQHRLLFSESCIKIISQGNEVIPKDFISLKNSTYCLSFKINITDLILLALELQKFPQPIREEKFKKVGTVEEECFERYESAKQLPDLSRITSEKEAEDMTPNTHHRIESFSSAVVGSNEQANDDEYAEIEKNFDDILMKGHIKDSSSNYLFLGAENSSTNKKSKVEPEHPLLFYMLEMMYSDRSECQKSTIDSYSSIFDMKSIKKFIISAKYIKEQTVDDNKVNKSQGYIGAALAQSRSELLDFGIDSLDNISLIQDNYDEEDEESNLSSANVILKFELLPEAIGILWDENIEEDQIIQDSEKSINIKDFDKNFINVFQEDWNESIGAQNDDSYDSRLNDLLNIQDGSKVKGSFGKNSISSLIPTIVKNREGEHRNHVLRLTQKTREVIYNKLVNFVTFFIKQKLNLMRYLRPMNSSIIKEVMNCLEQVNTKTIEINIDLKGYTASKEVLLKMMTDEIKSNKVMKFGYQSINDGEDIFFSISTKYFQNFRKKDKIFDQNEAHNRNFKESIIESGINEGRNWRDKRAAMIGKPVKNALGNKNNKNIKPSRFLNFRHTDNSMIRMSSGFMNGFKFSDPDTYTALGDFEIDIWMLLQIIIAPKEGTSKSDMIKLSVKCLCDDDEIFKEIETKFKKMTQEFENKLITRILLVKLNESREWPTDLVINDPELINKEEEKASVKSSFIHQEESSSRKASTSEKVQTEVKRKAAPPAKKSVKLSRMEKWAQKMKSVDSSNQPDKDDTKDNKFTSPDISKMKCMNCGLEKCSCTQRNNTITKAKLLDFSKQPEDSPSKRNEGTEVIALVEEDEVKNQKDLSQYEIKLVFVHKYKVPANINIKSIDNMNILKNLECNRKNIFVIKDKSKTFVFTLIDKSDDDPFRGVKTSASVLVHSDQVRHQENNILLKLYGVSDPSEDFLNDIVHTIDAQIKQITLMLRAKTLLRKKPNLDDYAFINDRSERVMLAFRLPPFIQAIVSQNFTQLLDDLRKNLIGTCIPFELEEPSKVEFFNETGERNSSNIIKSSFRISNALKNSTVSRRNVSATMMEEVGLENRNKDIVNTLLYNGFGGNTQAIRRTNLESHADKSERRNYGAALTNVIFGIKKATPEEFTMILNHLDSFAVPTLDEGNSPLAKPKAQKVNKSSLKGRSVLAKIISDGIKSTKTSITKTLDYRPDDSLEEKEKQLMHESDLNVNSVRNTIESKIVKEEIHPEIQDSYIYVHANYKGELKEERFASFLLSKLTDTIIGQFDKYLEYIKNKVSLVPTFSLAPAQRKDTKPLNVTELNLQRDLGDRAGAFYFRKKSDIPYYIEPKTPKQTPAEPAQDLLKEPIQITKNHSVGSTLEGKVEKSNTENIEGNSSASKCDKIDEEDEASCKEESKEDLGSSKQDSSSNSKDESEGKQQLLAVEKLVVHKAKSIVNDGNEDFPSDNIKRSASINIKFKYPEFVRKSLLSMIHELHEVLNESKKDYLIRSQLVVNCIDQNENIVKTYLIFIGSNPKYVELFLTLNADIIEAEGLKQEIKIVFKPRIEGAPNPTAYGHVEEQYLKQRMKGCITYEIRENFYAIDLESLSTLDDNFYDYFKEDNFDDLNDYFLFNLMHRQESPSREFLKGSSRLSQRSSAKGSVEFKEITPVEFALLEDPFQLSQKKLIRRSKSIDFLREEFMTFIGEEDHKSEAKGIEEDEDSLLKFQVNNLETLITSQDFAVIINITNSKSFMQVWEIEQDVANSLKSILNKHLDWYFAKFDYTVELCITNFGNCFNSEYWRNNESSKKSIKSLGSKSKEIREDKEDPEPTDQDPDSEESHDKEIPKAIEELYCYSCYAYKRRYDTKVRKFSWHEFNRSRLLRIFYAQSQDSPNYEKNMQGLNLIQILMKLSSEETADLEEQFRECLWQYLSHNILK